MMDALRKRAPFKSSNSYDNEEDNHILDEEEQEALIQALKIIDNTSIQRYLLSMQFILVLSLFLQILSFYDNPLMTAIPPTIFKPSPSIPLPAVFTLLSVALHVNLAFLAFSNDIKVWFSGFGFRPLSYRLSYTLSAVAPTLSVILQKSWQSTIWWSTTAAVIFTIQYITSSISQGSKSISELESMRFTAPGA